MLIFFVVSVVVLGFSTNSLNGIEITAAAKTGLSIAHKACYPIEWIKVDLPEKSTKISQFQNDWFTKSEAFPRLKLSDKVVAWVQSLKAKPLPRAHDVLSFSSQSRSKRSSGSGEHITTPMKTRKEYRQLNNMQRTSFHNAVKALKALNIGGTKAYDIFVQIHRFSMSPGSHMGAAFLPWHREFLLRFENALFSVGFTGPGLPYWDSTLDQTLPDPSAAQIWTAAYLGNNNGAVTSGPFTPWATIPGCGTTFQRNAVAGAAGKSFLYEESDINAVMAESCFKDISQATSGAFEGAHGSVHVWIGGQMGSINCAPTDPVFFMHHAFVDCVWEKFRQTRQTVSDRETEYPTSNYGSSYHAWDASMEPFEGLVNAHGISNHYTNYYYKCQNRPKFCLSHASCGNTATLWCDMSHCRCRPKVRTGGDCTGLPHRACGGPCFLRMVPKCISNTCTCTPLIIEADIADLSKISPVRGGIIG